MPSLLMAATSWWRLLATQTGGETGNDIFVARISGAGVVLDPGGFVVYSDPNEQVWPEVGFDGSNFLVTWVDYALPLTDPSQLGIIYARRVLPCGGPRG